MEEGKEQAQNDEGWKPSQKQVDRASRSNEILVERGIPTYHHPLYMDDDDEVELPSPTEVARRASVLWVVARVAGKHAERDAATSFLKSEGLWDSASPKEQAFLLEPSSDAETANSFVWRLEGLVALLWALKETESLNWPADMCDPRDLRELTRNMGGDLTSIPILVAPSLRPKAEILDAQHLTMMQHWAARNQMLKNGLPADLVFRFRSPGLFRLKKTKMHMGVVAERHYAFNWMTQLIHPAGQDRGSNLTESWDYVGTPT